LGDKLGALDTGKIADVVIANGDPLDVRTIVKQDEMTGAAEEGREQSKAGAAHRVLRSSKRNCY
jgi:hypothetical protein